ncbi:MAG TPA: RNA 2'-phosphotransferase [Candidatus Binatia bacterium]
MAGLPPERISRFLTYLLRHRPKEYPLVFDPRGFVEWRDVVEILQERYYEVTEAEIRAVVTDSEKKRFELQGNSVRATYGHSFPVDLGREAAAPPAKLYCGAARDLAASMLRHGLKPRDRQYVHLSLTAEEAESVARRHDPAPAVLVVDAHAAEAEGIQFYRSGPLFLVENVPAKFLSLK